jgi:hypothetical protein
VVIAAAVPISRSLSTPHRDETLDITTHGTGRAACRQLEHRQGLGYLADSRVITTAVATRWFGRLGGTGGRSVTVCVLAAKVNRLTVIAIHDQRPTVLSRGDYRHTTEVMTRLGALEEQEPSTIETAPFSCPRIDNDNVTLPGSATLPMGAVAARICSDGGWYYPSQVMTVSSGADNLVRAINAQPLTYQRGSTCGGTPGAHGYLLVFKYPRGTRTVVGDFCGWIGVGAVQRVDSIGTVGDHFLAMLEDQEVADGITPPSPCPTQRSAPPSGYGDLTHIVAARFCPAGATASGVRLSDDQLAQLTKGDPASGGGTNGYDGSYTRIENACPEPPAGWPHLMLSDAWHHQFSVTLKCKNLRFWELRLPAAPGHVVRPVLVDGAQSLLRDLARGTT